MKTLRNLGENEVIRRLGRFLPAGRGVIAGIGDDCAVVRLSTPPVFDLLLTSDPVIEGVHFPPAANAAGIGHKAVGRVVSDIAAMGGEPLWALIDVVAPPRMPMARLEGIYRAVGRLGTRWGLAVIGGDMAAGPTLELHVFAVGRVPAGTAILRSGARPGDILYVTGALGGSLAGRHLRFEPRLREGAWLRQGRWATAMMDVSDGLAADLPRLAAAGGVGMELDLDAIPVSAAAQAARDGISPVTHALGDGEDFELLFTVPARRRAAFEKAWRKTFPLACTGIGQATRGSPRVVCIRAGGRRTQLPVRGYDHFAASLCARDR